jgi:Rod binding protein
MSAQPTATDREKLAGVAKQFEAIFMRQMLAAARKTDFGGDNLFGSQAMGTFRQMQDEHFADVAAQTGTIGFATIIEAQMARFLPAESASAPAQTSSPGTSSPGTPSPETPSPETQG